MNLIKKKNSPKFGFRHDLGTYSDPHSEAGSGSRDQTESNADSDPQPIPGTELPVLPTFFPLYYLYLSLFLTHIFPLNCVSTLR